MLHLPIEDILPELIQQLSQSGSVVLRAPTGAGKTTRVPVALLESGLVSAGQIIVLEPRRVAARAAAARMAHERNSRLGTEVGYQVRFDSQASRDTRILVVTEGILLRRLLADPFLEGVAAVLFDEFHERNLSSDLALGMVRRVQQEVRPDLKVVVMSATLDPAPVAEYLGSAATVESQGRSFPVDIEFLRHRDPRPLVDLAVWGAQQMFTRTEGHVLVFLPGVGEIRRVERDLESFARQQQARIWSLYGDLPLEAQTAVLAPSVERKIVLATNVAETSLTIDGVMAVVDTGVARVLRYDPLVGLDRLQLEPISKASAEQRAGRAGRTAPGRCLRLWDEVSHRHRPELTDPEVRRVDLTGPVLQLKSWGEQDILKFPWFETPRADSVAQAELLLKRLGASTPDGLITPLGRRMAELPVHPRLARLLLAGQEFGVAARACWLAALLEERDPFIAPQRGRSGRPPALTPATHHSQSDVLDQLHALEEAERQGTTEFVWGTLHRGRAAQIQRVRDQLLRDLQSMNRPQGPLVESREAGDELLLRALVLAFPDRVAKRRSTGADKGLMVGGRGVKLSPRSAVRTGELFLCTDVDAGQTDAQVRQASLVQAEWLPAGSLSTRVDVFFHPSQKQVVARKRDYFEDLVLAESPAALPDTDEPARMLFQEAIKNWGQIFPEGEEQLNGYLARVSSLREWMPDLELPALDREQLEQVLLNLCATCRSFADLKKADWLSAVQQPLAWTQRQAIETEAPETCQVPSGSRIRLQYEAGRPPVLAVRIQEIFGMRATPRIAGGRIPILLHLLAPNMRPQQVTDDLASFWANTYPTVRKELARRYPRHPWPENPLEAQAIRK